MNTWHLLEISKWYLFIVCVLCQSRKKKLSISFHIDDIRFNPFNVIIIQFICSVTVPGYQGNLQAAVAHTSNLAAWERFGVEMVLTFIVVLAYFMSTDTYKSYFGVSSLSIGAAYGACSFVSVSKKRKFNNKMFLFLNSIRKEEKHVTKSSSVGKRRVTTKRNQP